MHGSSHELATITKTDHRGHLWVAVLFCMVFCTVAFTWRLVARRRRLGLEDTLAFIPFVLVITHSALLIGSLQLGFGVKLTAFTRTLMMQATKYVFASRSILYLSLACAQIWACLSVRRLVRPGTWLAHASLAGIVVVSVWCFSALLTTNLTCSASHAMLNMTKTQKSCQNQGVQMSSIMALNIVMEAGILVLAILASMSKGLEQAQKSQIIATGIGRIGVIAISISYIVLYLQYLRHGTPSIGFMPTAVSQELLVTYCFLVSIATTFFPLQISKQQIKRMSSMPLNMFGDKAKGSGVNVFKHRAKVEGNAKDGTRSARPRGSSESQEGIVRREDFEIKTATLSTADVTNV